MAWQDAIQQQSQPTRQTEPRNGRGAPATGSWRDTVMKKQTPVQNIAPESVKISPKATNEERALETMEASYAEARTRDSNRDPSIPEWTWGGVEMSLGNKVMIEGMLLAASDQRQAEDIIRKHAPDLRTLYDSSGNLLITDGTRTGYYNPPGEVSLRDASQFAADTIAYSPAGISAGMATKVLGRVIAGAVLSGATSAGKDVIAGEFGSEQGVSGERASEAAIFAGAFEAAAPLVTGAIRKLRGVRGMVRNGRLTNAGLAKAKRDGIIPEDMTSEMAEAFAVDAKGNVDPAAASKWAEKYGLEIEIPLTRGEATGAKKFLNEEEAMRAGARGEKAQSIMQSFDEARELAIDKATQAQQAKLGGPGGAHPREAGGVVAQGLEQESAALSRDIDEAYKMARGQKAELKVISMRGIVNRVKNTFEQEGKIIDKDLTPATKKAIGYLEDLNSKIQHYELGSGVAGVKNLKGGKLPFHELDIARRKIGQVINTAANKTDRANAIAVKRMMDDWVDEAFDNALFEGSSEALEQLKAARNLRREYALKFEPQNPQDAARKNIQKIIEHDATPDQTIDYIFGRASLGSKRESVQTIRQLKEVFTPESPEFGALREAAFLRVMKGMKTASGEFKKGRYVQQMKDALEGDGKLVMQELFTPNEMAAFRAFNANIEKMIIPPGVGNRSGSGYEIARGGIAMVDKLALLMGLNGDVVSAVLVKALPLTKNARQAAKARKAVGQQVTKGLPPRSTTGAALATTLQAGRGQTETE